MLGHQVVLLLLIQSPAPPVSPAEENPSDAAGFFRRGVERSKADDYDQAIKNYDTAIRLAPRHTQAYLQRGYAWHRKGDQDRAIADLTRAIELDRRSAEAHYFRGVALGTKKDETRAVADFTEAIRLDPGYALAVLQRGYSFQQLGDTDRAADDYTRYINLRPTDPQGHLRRARLRYALGEYHRSTFDYDEVIRLKPDHADAFFGRGAAWQKLKEYDRAIADATEAIRLNPKYVTAFMNRAEAYRMKNDHAAAVRGYTEVIQLDPHNAKAHDLRGWLRATSPDAAVRDGEQAVADARRACDLTGWANPDFIITLAAAEAECGRFAEAVKYENQALKNDSYSKGPQGEGSRRRLKLYEEGKAFREGVPAEVPVAAQAPEIPPEKVAAQYAFFGAVGLAVLSMVAFRLRRFGVFPFRRRSVPADPSAEPPVTPE